MDNILKTYYIKKYHSDVSLFVQTDPAFCCPALVTQAMTKKIEETTGVPVVTISYDGTCSAKNGVIIPYLTFRGKDSQHRFRGMDHLARYLGKIVGRKQEIKRERNQPAPAFRLIYYIMSSMPCGIPPAPGMLFFSSGRSAIMTSVVSRSPATDAAFCSANLVTFVGSMMPAFSMSSYSSVAALKP